MSEWLQVGGAGIEARATEWFGVANPFGSATQTSLGLSRLAYHQGEAAVRDARFAQMASQKSARARGKLTIAEMIALGPTGLWREAAARDASAAGMARYESKKTEIQPRIDRLREEAEQLRSVAIEMADGWTAIGLKDDLAAAEVDRRRAAVRACGWDDCVCGAAFQPGERGYSRCFRCNQIESADGRVKCALCSRSHAMKFGACFVCKSEGREETGAFLRSVITRRDHFTCQMCGTEEGQLQVDHVFPCALGGSAQPWNLQTLCTWCNILKGARYGPLDELARLELMQAYSTYLAPFLDGDERAELRRHLDEELLVESPEPFRKFAGEDHGTTEEMQGLLNTARAFGPSDITHV